MTQVVLRPKEKERGFTLFEILLAIAILGIITAIGFTSYTVSMQKARDGVRKDGLATVKSALEAHMNDKGVYPQGDASGRIVGCGNGTAACAWGGEFATSGGQVYMKKLPKEPRPAYRFFYRASSDGAAYQIYAFLENPNDPDINKSGTDYTANCDAAGTSTACNYGVTSSNVAVDDSL